MNKVLFWILATICMSSIIIAIIASFGDEESSNKIIKISFIFWITSFACLKWLTISKR
jgi:hypothetical protein